MATPREKLAQSLEALHQLQGRGGVAIRSTALSRTDRERLLAGGFLKEVMKGWQIPSRPDEPAGDNSGVDASFWGFSRPRASPTASARDWCLSPEQSLSLHGGNRSVPAQLFVRAPKGGNKPTPLPHGTSLFDMRASLPAPKRNGPARCPAAVLCCHQRRYAASERVIPPVRKR